MTVMTYIEAQDIAVIYPDDQFFSFPLLTNSDFAHLTSDQFSLLTTMTPITDGHYIEAQDYASH
jgi:hypothetical protein